MPLDPSLFFRGAELQMANDQMNRQTMDKFFTALAQSRQNQMPDIEKEAMAGLYTIEAGSVPTPKQQASLKVWQKLRQSEQMFDPATQSVIPKYNMSVFGVVPGELPTPDNYQPSFVPLQGAPVASNNPAMNMDTGVNKPVVDDLGLVNGGMMPPLGDNYAEVAGMTQDQRDMARGALPMPNNPRQAQTVFEAQADIAKKQAEAGMEVEKARQLEGVKKEAVAPKVKSGITNLASSISELNKTIDKAINDTDYLTAGFMGQKTQDIGGTPAANLKATLTTIGADSALSKLQEIRDASPTGGALGAITERELDLLRDSAAALAQSQSPDQLRENLRNYKRIRNEALNRVMAAYKEQYGEDIGAAMPAEPKRRRFNPATGQIE